MEKNTTTQNSQANSIQAEKKQSACGLGLSLFLCVVGSMFLVSGLHRIYTGKVATGILMCITLGGFFVWTIVDLIYLISGRFEDRHGLHVIGWKASKS